MTGHVNPEPVCLADYVDSFAVQAPAREAVVFEQERLSYRDVNRRVDQFAYALLSMGIRKGDRVAMLSTPRPEFWIALLGTTAIGAIWVGLNPKLRLNELRYIVTDSGPRVIFSIREFEGRSYVADVSTLQREVAGIDAVVWIAGSIASGPTWQSFLEHGNGTSAAQVATARKAVSSRDPALIVYTSGTTGPPKGAVLSHFGLTYGANLQTAHIAVAHPRLVVNFPISHVACIADTCATTLVMGGTIVFQERFVPTEHLAATARERCTILAGVPTMLQMWLALPDFSRLDLSSLELIVWGGAMLPVEAIKQLRQRGVRLMNVYGMTETSCNVTYTDAEADLDVLANSIGKPDRRCEFRILAQSGSECRAGEVGELQFRGEYLMLGYWNRAEATRDVVLPDGWMRTGDLGFARPDGNVTLVGRLSERYKSGGYNVHPREIELVLEALPSVAMAAVIGVPDPLYQQVGHAYVLPAAGQSISEAELRAHCQKMLANYKVPKRFIVRTELPMLPVGKIDKVRLKETADNA